MKLKQFNFNNGSASWDDMELFIQSNITIQHIISIYEGVVVIFYTDN